MCVHASADFDSIALVLASQHRVSVGIAKVLLGFQQKGVAIMATPFYFTPFKVFCF